MDQTYRKVPVAVDRLKKVYTKAPSRRMVKLRDAAAYLSVGMTTIRRLIHQGHLPYLQVGVGGITIDQRDLDAFIERNKKFS